MEQKDSLSGQKIFRHLQKGCSLSEMAYEALRDAITNGRIKPGERLLQAEVARELGVSERTVREAFARLVAKGLAISEPYKGFRVAALPIEDLKELYEIRALLEGRAMELAAERISLEELNQMEKILPLTGACDITNDEIRAQDANREFHWIPIKAAGSQYLTRILEQLWESMFTYDVIYRANEDERNQSVENDLQQHNVLLIALKARDKQKAKAAISVHIHRTLDMLLERL